MSSANSGEGVSNGGGHFLLGGAEPLSHSRLQVGQPGHQSVDRPGGILERFNTKEEIDYAEVCQKRQAEEEIRSGSLTKGSALRTNISGSDGGLSDDLNNRSSPRPS